jgi:glycine/D-amino acid oxidase-like deaminating enzyme
LSLKRAGKSVVLLDAYGPGNSRSSSGGESRIIRMGYGKDEIYSQWSHDSLGLWKELFRTVNQPLFVETGVLWLSRPNFAYTRESRETLERLKIPTEVLGEAELARRYPQIRPAPGMTGVLEPGSGALLARRAVRAVFDEALRAGCEFIPEAVAPPQGTKRLGLIRTNTKREISAGTFVFACGPWLPKLFPALLGKRIVPTRQEVFFFGTPAGDNRFAPPAMPVWIDFTIEAGPYGFPDLESRGFKLAFDQHGPRFDPDTGVRIPGAEGIAHARRYTADRFPALKGAPLVETRVCQYENTSNGDFLIDRHPELENVWLVGGGSGHGFKHGPAVGRYAAARILDGAAVDARFSFATKAEEQKRTVY